MWDYRKDKTMYKKGDKPYLDGFSHIFYILRKFMRMIPYDFFDNLGKFFLSAEF